MSQRQSATKFIKFLLSQQLTKLTDFIRDSGIFLSLFISLLTAVDVAALTYIGVEVCNLL